MSIEQSDRGCPECGTRLNVIYATELRQVVSAWSCPECGFIASEKHRTSMKVPQRRRPEEFVLRIERPVRADDLPSRFDDVEEEFAAWAREAMGEGETWTLVDAETSEVLEVVADRE